MLAEFLPDFYDFSYDRGLAARTVGGLKHQLGNFCRDFQTESSHCQDITPLEISLYIQDRCRGKSADLVKANVWAIKRFFAYLVLIGELQKSPADALGHAKYPKRDKLPPFLRPNDMDAILNAAAQFKNMADFVLISILLTTGLRASEAAGCARSAYESSKGYIRVKVKGGWIREVPLPPPTIEVIDAYLHSRSDSAPSLLLPPRGGRCTATWVRSTLKRVGVAAGIQEVLTTRLLRHTFATHSADRLGTDMTMTLMGHRNSKTTQVYTHMSPSTFRPVVNRHPFCGE